MTRSNHWVRVCFFALLLAMYFSSGARISVAATETLLTTQAPQLTNVSDGSTVNYELGAKFTSAAAGKVSAIRFWKATRETGTHVGHIWNAAGQLLATVTFANESASGWQQQSLASPLAVSANTVYLVTVNTSNTYYVVTDTGFAAKIINHDLSSVVGSNGVYGAPGKFPTSTYESSNYFRDVVFTPNTATGLTSSTAAMSLGNVNVGSSTSQTLTVTNGTTASVVVSKVACAGTGFSATGMTLPLTLAAGGQASLKVSFTAASMGPASGSVSITSNASNPTLTVALSAVGMQPSISVIPTSVGFGSVTVGVTNSQTLTIKDSGNSNLTVSQATVSGTGFTLTSPSLPATVLPGNSVTFTVRFSPTITGSVSGQVLITSNAPGSSLSIPLTGTGATQSLLLSATPSSLAFGNVTDGSISTQTVSLKNTGNASVSVSKLVPTGSYFTVSGLALPVTLTPGQTAAFNVAFAPTAAGTFSGSVSVTSTASNSPLSVSLTGSGVAATTHKASLNWTPSTSVVSGYNVYRGSQKGGPYTKVNTSLVPGSNYSDLSVQAGLTYYYVVTSVTSAGVESVHSSEVSATIP